MYLKLNLASWTKKINVLALRFKKYLSKLAEMFIRLKVLVLWYQGFYFIFKRIGLSKLAEKLIRLKILKRLW